MRIIFAAIGIACWAPATVVAGGPQSAPTPARPSAPPRVAFPMPEEPPDVNAQDPAEALSSFDYFCWRGFLSLCRTVTLSDAGLVQSDDLARPGLEQRPVWMTWPSRERLTASPPTWQDYTRGLVGGGQAGARNWAPVELDILSKLRRFSAESIPDVNQANDAPDSFVGPLVAQNRYFVRYEIRFNRIAYEYILRTKIYDKRFQPNEYQEPIGFPAGSIVVKAAWRVIVNDPDSSSYADDQAFKRRCFWTRASIAIDGKHQPAEVGLVGLHVIHRTSKRPQWVWSSFEHVDNVPQGEKAEDGKVYSFNYGTVKPGRFLRSNSDPDPTLVKGQVPRALESSAFQGEGRLLL